MGNSVQETQVFKGFLEEARLIAGAVVIEWHPAAQDPPDIEAELSDGRKVGVRTDILAQ